MPVCKSGRGRRLVEVVGGVAPLPLLDLLEGNIVEG